jgi:hypothetical protein
VNTKQVFRIKPAPIILLFKSVSRGDKYTLDMFGGNQGGLFTAPSNVHGYTDKNGRTVAPHTAGHKHKIMLAKPKTETQNKDVGATPAAQASASRATDNQSLEMKMSNTYTFHQDHSIKDLRGKTFTVAKFDKILNNGKRVDAAVFKESFQGKPIMALVSGKPELEAMLAAKNAEKERKAAADRAAAAADRAELEAAVPGVTEYESAMRKYQNAQADYERASERGYPAKEAAAASAADVELRAVMKKYPATALWRKVQGYVNASNYDKQGAGMAADSAIRSGTPIADAVEEMEAAWKSDAERAMWNS